MSRNLADFCQLHPASPGGIIVGMIIADRLRVLREQKKLSQGDIEKRTGLFRCYISRVENGHTVPAVQTLEKMACALEVPLYVLFYDGEKPPPGQTDLPKSKLGANLLWGSSGKDARTLAKFCRLLGKIHERDRLLILSLAKTLVSKSKVRARTK